MTNDMKIGVYARVSTGQQEREETIETQLMTIRDTLEDKYAGIEIVGQPFLDEGKSGDTTHLWDRPGGQRLIAAVRRGLVDTVVVYKRDRLGRGGEATLAERELKKANRNVRFIYATEPHLITRQAKRGDDFQSGMYVDIVRENTMRGKARSATEGSFIMPFPNYGYRKVEVPELSRGRRRFYRLEIREDQAAVVRQVFALVLDGKGPGAIVNILNEAHVPTPADEQDNDRRNSLGWGVSTIRRIVKRPRDTWTFKARDPNDNPDLDRTITVDIPPIVDEPTWRMAQDAMQSRSRAPRRTGVVRMLQGILTCAACGGRMSPVPYGSKGFTYRCSKRSKYGKVDDVVEAHRGQQYQWRGHVVEERVKAFIRRIFENPTFLAGHVERRLAAIGDQLDEALNAETHAQAEVDRLRAEVENVKALGRQGFYGTTADALDEMKKVRADLAAAEKHLRAVAKTTQRADVGKDMLRKLQSELAKVWTPALADHIRERTEQGYATVRIELPSQALPEPKTVAEWKRLLTYFVDRITVDGADHKLTLHYEGVLGRPFPLTLDADGELVEQKSQRR